MANSNLENFEEARIAYEDFEAFARRLERNPGSPRIHGDPTDRNECNVRLGIKQKVFLCSSRVCTLDYRSPLSAFEELCHSLRKCGKSSQQEIKQGAYLGIITKEDSQKKINNNGQFAIYHRLPRSMAVRLSSKRFSNDDLEPLPTLYLNIVYKRTSGEYRHYPIIEIENIGADSKPQKLYQVIRKQESNQFLYGSDSRKAPEPLFTTIEKLLDHYSKFAYGYKFNEDGGIDVDVF
ncbi:unnamed protein product [Caenorhabditis bovis]|uniref:SH2 domain-containing protein n=1 Tax=Caenorhabditis bovis TaxID=2654633 RepID=A0A8S1ETP8_9PELO|nr:unnamed protein product [Caenorhabditis bovis]